MEQVWERKKGFPLGMKHEKWEDNAEEVGIGVTMYGY